MVVLHVKAPEARPPGAGPGSVTGQLAPRPPLPRVDSRSSFPTPPAQRPPPAPGAQPLQPRPLFQPGGPVTNPPQFTRPGTPAPRGLAPTASQLQALRVQAPPIRPTGPQPFALQQGPRQQPPSLVLPQRAPPPNNLQFGPRQPSQFGAGSTPDGSKPSVPQPVSGAPRNGTPTGSGPPPLQLSGQPSQGSIKGLEASTIQQNKQVILDNHSININPQNAVKSAALDMPGAPKSRSYSIAEPPGAPSPLKMDDDRRKSISVVGGRIDEMNSRSSGLGLIQESNIASQESVRGSIDSVKPELLDRPESRHSAKISESIIGALPTSAIKKRSDDDDDVVLQNTAGGRNFNTSKPMESSPIQVELPDRSPSLSRSEDSPEPKQVSHNKALSKLPTHNGTAEPKRPEAPATNANESQNTSVKQAPRSPLPDTKPPSGPVQKKPSELINEGPDSKKSTPRKTASAPKYRTKGNILVELKSE